MPPRTPTARRSAAIRAGASPPRVVTVKHHRHIPPGEQPRPLRLPGVITRHGDRGQPARARTDHVRRPLHKENPSGRFRAGVGISPSRVPRAANTLGAWSVAMDQKLLFEVDLADVADGGVAPAKPLRLLSRASLVNGELDLWGERVFTDARVRKVLSELAADPPRGFLNAIEQAVGTLAVPRDRLKEEPRARL